MRIRRSVLPLLALTVLAPPAGAQPEVIAAAPGDGGREWFGNMELVMEMDPATGTDRSWAAVTDSTRTVVLYWACVDLDLYIQLEPADPLGGTRLTWRFDDEEPRTATAVLRTNDSTGATSVGWPAEEHDAFTARAKTARRLAVWMPMDDGRRELGFDLRGAAPALGQLPCLLSRNPPGAGEYALGGDRPWLDDPDFDATDRAAMLVNPEEVMAAMQESYPEPLYRKGGEVILVLRVERDGTPNLPSVRVRRSTHAALTRAALQVAPRLRFQPAIRDGRPVPGWVQVPLNFLPDSPIPDP